MQKAEETGWFRAADERFYREIADPGTNRKAAFARMTRAAPAAERTRSYLAAALEIGSPVV